MNKNVLIAGIVLVVLVAGAGAYMMLGKKPQSAPTQNIQQAVAPTGILSFADMYAKAMAGNSSIKCTFEAGNSTGTSYIKNGMVKLDSLSTTNKKTHVIFKNKIVWTWNEGETAGITMDTTAIQAQITGAMQQYTKPENIQKQLEANKPNCVQESIADSMFEVPTTIKFTDYTKMMQGVKSKMPANITIPPGYKVPGM